MELNACLAWESELKEEPEEGGPWQAWWSPCASNISHKSGAALPHLPKHTAVCLVGLLSRVELCPPQKTVLTQDTRV